MAHAKKAFYSEAMNSAILPEPDLHKLREHLLSICIERDILQDRANLLKVAAYVQQTLESCGWTVERQPFSHQGLPLHNLIASIPSKSEPKAAKCIIGAHFDAVPGTPGADDNASGVAVMLEAARLLANHPNRHLLEFAAFNAEEYGMIGSAYYAKQLKRNKIRILGMLSLEMVGYTDPRPGAQKIPPLLAPFYPNTGDFLALVGDTKSAEWLKAVKTAFQKVPELPVHSLSLPGKGWVFPECRLSDHSPFWDEGYPALLVTDTSFFRNPHYHLASDTIESLDLPFMSRVVSGIVSLADKLHKI